MTTRWKPHATVATIVERDNKFLLVEEYTGAEHPVFNQPAGHIEENEAIVAAAIRETLEETGWHVEPLDLVGIYIYKAPNGVTYHRYCLRAKAIRFDEQAELDTGIIGPQWMSIDEIKACPRLRSPLVLTSIEDYLAGKRFPLSLISEHLS